MEKQTAVPADVRKELARALGGDLRDLTLEGFIPQLGMVLPPALPGGDFELARRRAFAERVDDVERVARWLVANVHATTRMNRKYGSYGLKHTFARALGPLDNGVLIAAAVLAGYVWERRRVLADDGTWRGRTNRNACFGFADASIRKIALRAAAASQQFDETTADNDTL